MKKFFSILCALAIVLGVNAAQISKKDVLAGKVAKKEIRSQHASKHVAKSATLKAFDNKTSVVKVAPKKHVIAGKEVAGLEKKNLKAAVALKAPQAKKEVISFDLNTENADIDWNDHCADAGWWQIEAENDEVYFSISNLDREVAAGEYAWEDLDPDYTCAFVEDWVYFTDGSCTVAVDDSEALKVTVEGSFTGEDGNTYNVKIVYEEEPIVPGDIDFVATKVSSTYYASDNDVYYKLYDEKDNVIYFDIVLGDSTLEDVEADKVYTLDDMLAEYTKVNYDGTAANFTEASFKKYYEGLTEKIEATATDEYGRIFHVSYEFKAPEAEKFETITAEATITKEAYWFWYLYTISAADEANSIVLEILPDDTYYGTWEAGKDITGAVAPLNGVASEIYSGEVTIAPTAEGCAITGKVLCYNNTEYTLNLTYTKPGPTREEVLDVEGLALDVFEGAWQLSGYNEDSTKYVSIAAYTDEITGNYTDADLAADYCYVVTDITDTAYNYFEMLSADLTVQFTEEDSTIIIAGTFVGQNGEDIPQFTMLLKGRIPAPEASDMTFNFSIDEEGITVTPSNDNDPWDWYVADAATLESFGGPDGLAQAVYDYYGNYYAVTGEQFFSFEDLAYYTSAGGTFYFVVWGAGERNITTEAASFEFEVEPGSACTQYDAEEGNDFIVDFAEYEIDERYLESYGVIIVDALDDEGQYLSLQLLLAEGATGLAAGEYPVLEDGEGPLTFAGELDLTEGSIYGSFAGNLTAQGISVPLWLLVEGTVTVAENGVITVDAVNCAGAAIKCVLAAAQGIENVVLTQDAKKVVVDGVLYIVRDGKMFNVQGAQVR